MKVVGAHPLLLRITAALFFNAVLVMGRKYMSKPPEVLNLCKQSNANFNKCLANNLLALAKEWKDGVPGLASVGSYDPLLVKKLTITQDSRNSVSIQSEQSNMVIRGMAEFQIPYLNFDVQNRILSQEIFIPKLDFHFDYKFNGRILQLPLNGNGKGHFVAENVVMQMVMKVKLVEEHNHIFGDIVELKIVIKDIGSLHMDFSNLLNGNKVLEESILPLLNENWRDIFESLRPSIEKAINAIFLNRLKKIFAYIPTNYFIADLNLN